MGRQVRLLGCAAAMVIGVGAVSAEAQTVIVRRAAPAAPIEVLFDQAPAGTGTVEASGDGTVELTTFPVAGPEVAAAIHVDRCGETIRVRLVPRAAEVPAASGNCQRQTVPGFFVIRSNTTLVIDLVTTVPTVRIAQGRAPEEWFLEGPIPTSRQIPVGLIGFGGAGIGRLPGSIELLCGNDTRCRSEDTKLTFGMGVDFWVTRFLGLEAGFIRPGTLVAINDFETDPYTSTVKPRVLTLAVLGGFPIGSVRFYGRAGANYHRTTFRTVQVTNSTTVTVDGVPRTFPATSQTFLYDTVGWSPLWGGGVEGWVGRTAAIFIDFTVFDLKGENTDIAGTRLIDDRGSAILAGVKIQILGR